MSQLFRSMMETMWILILFLGCTIIFYYGILWVSTEYERYHRYDEPKGDAVKVATVEESAQSGTVWERLRLFYQIGQ
ncbi:YqzK family protein [Texcoconibacillus texcoconensis]|uniref:DUF4227 family protein n=1 Tax=Texcoconibacillus texcoconensis TaxID=1095777 RepID=A0A840QNP2_9BACI|nr:YqzK family protein [Texcoconibacillus texcoconensis]MBB5172989.1 hypothetical protein [Texcoconibacillus texcoconensis]